MVQSKRMVEALKQQLKAHGISYQEVARHLELSVSSVKRMFSTSAFTLARFEMVCDLAGVDLLELARLADGQRLQVSSLTVEQERDLVGDPALLPVAVSALNRWSFEKILGHYRISAPELTRLLVRLDRMGLIELLPGNRIRLRVARNFAWLPDGPIHRFFIERVQSEFLSGEFAPDRDLHRFAWGMLSAESAAALRARMAELMEAFDDLTRGDEVRPDDAARGTCLLVALRQWEPAGFRALRRTP